LDFVNRTKRLLKEGKPAVGNFVCIPSYDVAEIFSKVGLDWELFDMEHSSIHFDILHWLLAAASGGSTLLVRVPSLDLASVKLALDGGAQGIMFPQINTKQDAEKAVKACRYPPQGVRGMGPRRASFYYTEFSDYVRTANQETLVIVQIETREAVENVEEILSVEGIDVAFVGPGDLSTDMGYISTWPTLEKEVVDALEKVLRVCKARGIAPGLWGGGPEKVNKFIKDGWQFIVNREVTEYFFKVKEDVAKLER
jgi:2-dehydro-3-deoxyglucarate aldolase